MNLSKHLPSFCLFDGFFLIIMIKLRFLFAKACNIDFKQTQSVHLKVLGQDQKCTGFTMGV
jgi:hypothetical protein